MSARSQLRAALAIEMGKAQILNFEEVARRAGLQGRTVRGLHDGTTVKTLRKIAGALGCSAADLLRGVAVSLDSAYGKSPVEATAQTMSDAIAGDLAALRALGKPEVSK